MRRRDFLKATAALPVAASVPLGLVPGGEVVKVWVDGVPSVYHYRSSNPARVVYHILAHVAGRDRLDEASFIEAASFCEEPAPVV